MISDEEIAATIRLTLETMPTGAPIRACVPWRGIDFAPYDC